MKHGTTQCENALKRFTRNAISLIKNKTKNHV